MEQLVSAVKYGADAVYTGSSSFSLRAHADNLTALELGRACDIVHKNGKRIYVAMNSIIKPEQMDKAYGEVKEIINAGADAIIFSDPAVLEIVNSLGGGIDLHLSTQVSTCNHLSAEFWQKNGVKRIVLGRECTLSDIKQIKAHNSDLDLEAFCHGAMCIAYSGRCLLSSYFTGRSANCGDCTQTCRWQFNITEVKRPNDTLTIEQYGDATYILSSKDLCMIEHLPDMIESGISSFKIEGRMKTAFYVATVVRAYRRALDAVLEGKPVAKEDVEETLKVSHREYTTGFFYGNPLEQGQQYGETAYTRDYEFTGVVLDYLPEKKQMLIEQRSKFVVGDTLEVLTPGNAIISFVVENMYDEEGNRVEEAPHPKQRLCIDVDFAVQKNDFIRKATDK
ncbi:MAG: U32 family peptidase [Clostridia bacterium]|nr:U32 family peptidase [Clostridia bacterium]